MLKKVRIILFFWCATAFILPSQTGADIFEYDYSEFAKIAVLHEGRVKPLDTFAGTNLELFYGRDSFQKTPPIEWLAEVLFNPEKSYRRKLFNVPNPKVVDALELERRKKHRYSYQELTEALTRNFIALHPLFYKPREELSLAQRQLLELYSKMQMFAGLSRSLSLVFPEFEVPEGKIAEVLGVKGGTVLTYLEVRRQREAIEKLAKKTHMTTAAESKKLTAQDAEVFAFATRMQEFENDRTSQILRVIPPQWEESKELWFSPWSITQAGYGSPQSAKFLKMWKELVEAYRGGDNAKWIETSRQLHEYSLDMAGDSARGNLLSLEVSFNRLKLFTKSLIFYLLAFLVMLAGFMFWPKQLRRAAFILLGIGFILHAFGIGIRMIIMARPPVTNLYESIIFVGFVGVFSGILMEWRKKNGFGIVIAGSLGTMLHFLVNLPNYLKFT